MAQTLSHHVLSVMGCGETAIFTGDEATVLSAGLRIRDFPLSVAALFGSRSSWTLMSRDADFSTAARPSNEKAYF
jgi:hypothetical protein